MIFLYDPWIIGFGVSILSGLVLYPLTRQNSSKKNNMPIININGSNTGTNIIQLIKDSPSNDLYIETKEEISHKSDSIQNPNDEDDCLEFKELRDAFKDKDLDFETGYIELDKILGEIKNGQLVVVGSLPDEGRTNFLLGVMLNNALEFNKPILFFSMGAKAGFITDRMISIRASVDADKLSSGNLTDDEFDKIEKSMKLLGAAPLFIDDCLYSDINLIEEKIGKLIKKTGNGLIIIDGLEYLDRYPSKLKDILIILKKVALNFNTSVIISTPFEKKFSDRGGIPRLSDLENSFSSLPDLVLGLYNSSYDFPELKRVRILKNRNGSTGEINLFFDRARCTFLYMDPIKENGTLEDEF